MRTFVSFGAEHETTKRFVGVEEVVEREEDDDNLRRHELEHTLLLLLVESPGRGSGWGCPVAPPLRRDPVRPIPPCRKKAVRVAVSSTGVLLSRGRRRRSGREREAEASAEEFGEAEGEDEGGEGRDEGGWAVVRHGRVFLSGLSAYGRGDADYSL